MAQNKTLPEVESQITNHERICALRYQQIDEKLESLQEKFDLQLQPIVDSMEELKDTIKWLIRGLVAGFGGVILMEIFGK